MHVLVSVDMEGISGVVSGDALTSNHKDYDRFRRLMTAETNAAIEGALDAGAERIIVADSHGDMTNILIEELHPAAQLVSGAPRPFSMMQGIGPDVNAVFMVGYHSMSGTPQAILEHTYSGRVVYDLRLNGQAVGEMGLNAALAGGFGVPVTLVTGDRATTEQARSLLGEIETVAVKEALSRTSAQCLAPTVAQQRIRQAAQRAARLAAKPFIIPPPITVTVLFPRASYADLASMLPGSRRPEARTVEWVAEDMTTAYRAFRVMVALASGG